MLHFFTTARIYLAALLVLVVLAQVMTGRPASEHTTATYIVQSGSVTVAGDHVAAVGGVVRRELAIINAVAADLNAAAAARLHAQPGVRLYADTRARASDEFSSVDAASTGETYTSGDLLYPAAAANVAGLHLQRVSTRKTECKHNSVTVYNSTERRPLRGSGVTVAVIDSGFMRMASSGDWKYYSSTGTLFAENSGRCIVYRDFTSQTRRYNSDDPYGHGTHVAATIADQVAVQMEKNKSAAPVGIAPDVNLLVARALGADGSGSYVDIIAAIDWIVANKTRYNVRVLNLSLYSPVDRHYRDDPLNQAVMRAWQAGIVVVVAAGNGGPQARTIGAPGNVPYVITVGALVSGRYTASGSDELASYSGRGPTESDFVKPDLVLPASRTIAPMPNSSALAINAPPDRMYRVATVNFGVGAPGAAHNSYQLSGTSMAAAQVSGVVALMLQKDPTLTNDQVKYRLMTTARQSFDPAGGAPRYTIWEQGAGLIDAPAALATTSVAPANVGLNIARDLDLTSPVYYWGYTTRDDTSGEYRLFDPASGLLLESWAGGERSWAGGDPTAWAGGERSWAGGDPTAWAGGERSWAGGGSLQTLDVERVVQSDIITDDVASVRPIFTVYLPLVGQP